MNRIRTLRQESNMSQKDLANELGVSQGCVSSWENGSYAPDRVSQMFLCYIFRCTYDYLMGYAPDAKSGERGWSADMETNYHDFLMKNSPAFAACEKRREESVATAEQEWLQDQVCEEDPEVRAEAMQAYMEDEWEKTGRIGTLESFEITMMMDKLSIEDRRKLVNVARAMFPDAAII